MPRCHDQQLTVQLESQGSYGPCKSVPVQALAAPGFPYTHLRVQIPRRQDAAVARMKADLQKHQEVSSPAGSLLIWASSCSFRPLSCTVKC